MCLVSKCFNFKKQEQEIQLLLSTKRELDTLCVLNGLEIKCNNREREHKSTRKLKK